MRINRSIISNFNPDADVTFGDGVTVTSLAGTGSRMVIADSVGLLSTQAIPSGTVTGTGTTNYIPKWTSSTAIGNSLVYDDGTNVGIGTTSPAADLHIYRAGSTAGTTIGLKVNHECNTEDYVVFFTGNESVSTNRFVMTQVGNVGIGTTSPNSASVDRALTISGTSNSILEINYGSTRGGYFFTNSINTVLSSVQNVPLLFNTNDVTRLTIAASTGAATFSSTIRSNDASGLALGSIAGYRRLQYDLANTRFGFLTDSNSFANIEALGGLFNSNVGIGGISPSARLSIQGTGTYNSTGWGPTSTVNIRSNELTNDAWNSVFNIATIRQSLTTGKDSYGGIGFTTIDDSNNDGINDAGRIAIINENTSSLTSPTAMSFWTNTGGSSGNVASENLRITSGGNLIINPGANNGAKLQVNGTGYVSGNVSIGVLLSAWSSSKVLQVGVASINEVATVVSNYTVNAYDNAGWKYIASNYASRFSHDNGDFNWYTAAAGSAGAAVSWTRVFKVDAAGDAIVKGTLGINNVNDSVKGTTYTPTISNTVNITSSSVSLSRYTRVGNMVTVSGQFVVNSPNNNAIFSFNLSLPVGSAFANTYECSGMFVSEGIAGNYPHAGFIKADVANDKAYFETIPLSQNVDRTYHFMFTYTII